MRTSTLLLLALTAAAPLSAAAPWAQLKVGMNAEATETLLGEPLARRQGHGFETWTYDDGAEVLIHASGEVVGWTAPGAAALPKRSADIWSSQPAGKLYATMHSVLPRATASRLKAAPIRPANPASQTYEGYLRG